jgi:aminopeptidase N
MVQRRSLLILLVALLLAPLVGLGCSSGGERASGRTAVDDSTTHYRIDARIRPDSSHFDVAIEMRFVPEAPTDTLRFLLHDALKLQTLTASAVDGYSTRPWRLGGEDTLHTNVVTVPLTRTATPSDPVAVTWEYAGRLPNEQLPGIGGAVVSPHWTELPIEAMWVPVHASISKRFTFDAMLDVPDGYEVVSTGSVEAASAGWRIRSAVPGPDVPLVISDRMAVRERMEEGLPVSVYHGGAPDSVTTFVAESATQVLDRYAQRFEGGSETDALRITVAPVERATPASYARTGFIALNHGAEPDPGLFGLIAHEAAHLWWTDAVDPLSRHNFLNESFAEYESWLALRAEYGSAVFQDRLTEARKRAQKAPSFREWTPRTDGVLSYNKGPVLLHRLHQRIGDAEFQSFVAALQRDDVGTLDGMVTTLETVTSAETADWFEAKL